MADRPTNINTAQYKVGEPAREGESAFRFLDISGEHLGVKAAGQAVAHHIENTSDAGFWYSAKESRMTLFSIRMVQL